MSVIVGDLTKKYGSQNAVDSISFSATSGEIVGFLGPNGAGKSTTMKMITGYLPPTSGTIQVCGYDVVKNSMQVRKNIGYLPEHNPLYLDMYVHEYLQFIGSLHGLKGKVLKDRIAEMIERVGLTLEQSKKIGTLSKGYRQRVGLASTLIHNPPVLILDEPTTGLDPNQIIEIRNLIKDIGKEKTVLFSTHLMQEVEAICNRVLIINKGKIVADNTATELQKLKNKKTALLAEFAEDINEEIIKKLPSVNSILKTGKSQYEIVSNDETDVRGAIFKLATENNWTLIGLKQQENTLESVFQELTK